VILAGTRVPLPAVPVAHHVFERHARTHPDRPAVVCGAVSCTYGELNARANQFAHHLTGLGLARGSVVGVCLDRSVELMVAILKAGAAYVPLDPGYPGERLRLMVEQLPQMALVVAAASTLELAGADRKWVDLAGLTDRLATLPVSDPDAGVTGDDLCYVVFTSGSTGLPKATAVRHEGWYNLLNWLTLEYGLGPHSANLMISAFGFDISQRSLMTALFTGAAQHLLPSRNFDTGLAHRLIGEHGVRTLHCAPSMLYLLVEREMAVGGDALARMDYVFIGGEPMRAGRVEEWARREGNRCVLLHQYGVAECTDVASSHRMIDYEAYRAGPLPAGPPVYNTEIRLMSPDLVEVPPGEVGEICITGTSVGAGYLNAAPAEAAKFTEIERDGERLRLYRTGDSGYGTASGELVVLGRLDAQIKIRGMRVDLADVERVARDHPRVTDVVVVPVPAPDGQLDLIAYVVPAGGAFDPGALRDHMLTALPRNMVPRDFVELPELPLNPNGKVDRRALSAAR
jgi:D-alanine--poly(phosphoribitol) ligase subunit 1